MMIIIKLIVYKLSCKVYQSSSTHVFNLIEKDAEILQYKNEIKELKEELNKLKGIFLNI
jgi:hypothetical protein